MTQKDRAQALAALQFKGNPLVLYNIWDAGSALAVQAAGAKALATGSWSVAGAQGFDDGQALPLDMLLSLVTQIIRVSEVPVTVDFEGAYAIDPQACAENVRKLIRTGAVGSNFEDQVGGGEGLHRVDDQVARIVAIRQAADDEGIPLVLNARTDLFLKERDPVKHAGLIADALVRASAYQEAGASCFFAPGLTDDRLIAALCEAVTLPVNVMKGPKTSDIATLAGLGVSRVSYGPGPFRQAMKTLEESARAALS
mgnify:CR=1 FL=1